MKAQEAVDGGSYDLPARGQYTEYRGATCNGWNHTREWLLFVVNDEKGNRKIRMVMPTEEIVQAVELYGKIQSF